MNETWWIAQEQLNEAQGSILGLPLNKSYLVLGPPGSGKTNLLLLRANYAYLAGQHGLSIVVFTRSLQEFLRAGAGQYDFPAEKIVTSVRWMTDLLLDFGRTVPEADKFDGLRKALLSEVKELIEDKKLSKIFELILLDESQDYWPEELEIFSKLAERVFIVADGKQKIYKGKDSTAFAQSLVDQVEELSHHYRNGIIICKLADGIGKAGDSYQPMEPTAQYDESARPSTVEVYKCEDLKGQIAKILEKLDLQRKTYPDELIGICCPTNADVETIWAALQATDFAEVSVLHKANEHAAFNSDTRICVGTIHAAKGLEFRALHLAAMDKLKSFSYRRNIAFMAVTRAKTSLSLYFAEELPSFLDAALGKLKPMPNIPKLAAAFGKPKGK